MSKKIYIEVSEDEYTDAKKMDFYVLIKEYLRPAFEQALENYRTSRSNGYGRIFK